MKHYSTAFLILLLAPCVMAFAFGLDIYIPIAPAMVNIFNTTPSMVQLTLSLFLLTLGVGQLLVGPFSDQFGRRPTLYISAACYTLGALASVASTTIGWLIVARILTGVGACGMLVLAFAIVRDLYSGKENAKLFSFLQSAIGISPTFAPIFGGYLAVHFGWHSVFYFLAILGCIVFLVTNLFILETLESSKKIKFDHHVFKHYWSIFKEPQFSIYAAISGLANGVFFGFFSVSPFIIIDLLKIPTDHFGLYFAAFGAVIALGGVVSGKTVYRFGISRTLLCGVILVFLGGISMLLWDILHSLSMAGFLIPMVIACTGAMFLLGASAAAALEKFDHMVGTSAAALGFVEFCIPSFIGSLLLYFPITSSVSYAICIIGIGIATCVLLKIGPKTNLA